MQTCWWPPSDHWSVQPNSPHLSGCVFYGCLESLTELFALWTLLELKSCENWITHILWICPQTVLQFSTGHISITVVLWTKFPYHLMIKINIMDVWDFAWLHFKISWEGYPKLQKPQMLSIMKNCWWLGTGLLYTRFIVLSNVWRRVLFGAKSIKFSIFPCIFLYKQPLPFTVKEWLKCAHICQCFYQIDTSCIWLIWPNVINVS